MDEVEQFHNMLSKYSRAVNGLTDDLENKRFQENVVHLLHTLTNIDTPEKLKIFFEITRVDNCNKDSIIEEANKLPEYVKPKVQGDAISGYFYCPYIPLIFDIKSLTREYPKFSTKDEI